MTVPPDELTPAICRYSDNYVREKSCLDDSHLRGLKQYREYYPDSKFHGAYMGPTLGPQDPGGSHVGPMNFLGIYVSFLIQKSECSCRTRIKLRLPKI